MLETHDTERVLQGQIALFFQKKIDRGEYHKKIAGGGFTALKCSRCGFDIEKGDSADMTLDHTRTHTLHRCYELMVAGREGEIKARLHGDFPVTKPSVAKGEAAEMVRVHESHEAHKKRVKAKAKPAKVHKKKSK
jgi:hypothetical protein